MGGRRVQVCAQVLLLREHGYACERGRDLLRRDPAAGAGRADGRAGRANAGDRRGGAGRGGAAGATAAAGVEPEVPALLPGRDLPAGRDQHARRAERREAARLIAAEPDAAPLYVTEPGSFVGIDGGRLTVSKHRETLASVRLIDVLHVCAYGNIQVTAQAMRSLFERDIDVFHFSYGGWLLGMTTGLPSKNVMLRIRQTTAAARGQLDAPRRMIAGKIRNCRVLLRRNGGEAVGAHGRPARRAGPACREGERGGGAARHRGGRRAAVLRAFPAARRAWRLSCPDPASPACGTGVRLRTWSTACFRSATGC